jgi:tyrosyl-tRNA synthetase
MQNELLQELSQRGFINQASNLDGLNDALNDGKITAYLGSDPTADSLHVGHLVPLMMMRWFHKYGHKVILLIGGATARIGDPSGRDTSRPMMTDDQIINNSKGLLQSFLQFIPSAVMVDNYDWQSKISNYNFMKEYAMHFSVPQMLAMESVKLRLSRPGGTISFLEFSYMTLQAIDFLELYKKHNCILQTCGADQWGNAIMGVELIRKKLGKEAFVLSTALITDSNGNKIGKSAGNAVWVNEDKTSPYEYYQYFRNTPDELVEKFLKIFTEIPLLEIEKIMTGDINQAKKQLAFAATEIAHGMAQAEMAETQIPIVNVSSGRLMDVVAIVYKLSKSDARRTIEQGGISVANTVKKDPNEIIGMGEYIFQKGKKKIYNKVIVK